MGNADLRALASIREVSFDELDGTFVAVDAHNWLYRYLTTTVKFTDERIYTTDDGEEVANLIGVVQGLPKFFEHDLTPVFVFDGGVTELKSDEVQRRREKRESAQEQLEDARDRGDAIAAARLEARTQRLTDVIQETTRGLFDRLDVPYVEAPAEGEAQCAYMARVGDVDYAGSEDYDTLLFGAPLTLRQLTSSGNPELMDLEATLAELDLTLEQLVDVAILCGTDFNEGISGVGPKTAVTEIKEHGDLWGVLDARDTEIPDAEQVRQLYFDPPVTTKYEFDESIDPDVAAAKQYVTDEWEIPAEEVARGFERLEEALTQTGLDRWT
ncbi:5'-3' exonuclease [Halalkaliarchaeum sp. AArc-CO]|uniref:flap endonuclease-1 n=1 Tax=unclassified Halalkaliarchaeum TaxID=2678344 RepID=UPI00217F11BD|nr:MULTISPECIES: flap endonuclease-1 [unclassified Halalkaliarchaeum]MDR5674186.1 flap endonuclease-1 [Halalkaliarchaeum sp. AArc-GB]UWG50904.1 5'-3' exonuclease [Halalkaliarchaeum sp. AArc-CO]